MASLIAPLLLAGYLRWRRVRALIAIAGAGLIMPTLVAFTAFIYPADLPAADVASILKAGGFDQPALFYQAGLIHAWFSKRPAGEAP